VAACRHVARFCIALVAAFSEAGVPIQERSGCRMGFTGRDYAEFARAAVASDRLVGIGRRDGLGPHRQPGQRAGNARGPRSNTSGRPVR
jgi:hypothetical protein